MRWIYLSPHLDDAVYSCGGLIWEQARDGQSPEIWTVCAGDAAGAPLSGFAAEMHARWESGPETPAFRRREDRAACARVGAASRYLPFLDAIYRGDPANPEQMLYQSNEALFGPLDPREAPLVARLAAFLAAELPPAAELACPLALGGHVDHRLVRQAAESLGRPLWYYADYPYAAQAGPEIAALPGTGLRPVAFPLPAAALQAWQAGAAAYASQVSTFWKDEAGLREALKLYSEGLGGACLWQKNK